MGNTVSLEVSTVVLVKSQAFSDITPCRQVRLESEIGISHRISLNWAL
jgi:hypothetical protein